MKFAKYSMLLMFTSSLLVGLPAHGETAQTHGARGSQGGRVGHMAGKAATNTNAQWSADPERGWIRAEERKGMKNPHGRSTQRTQGKSKQVDKGKKF